MKRIRNICILACVFFIPKYSGAHVTLEYPVGGEYFYTNEVITIKWRLAIEHIQKNWDLFYSKDNGTSWDTIALDIANEITEYSWIIPDDTTSKALIMITQDNDGPDYSSVSRKFSINIEPPTSRETLLFEKKNLASLSVYPIPSFGEVFFSFELLNSQHIKIEVFNLSGKLNTLVVDQFLNRGSHTICWNTSILMPGIYLFRITGAKDIITGRLIL